jgi:hypothetical protein
VVKYVTHIQGDQIQLPAIMTDVLIPFCSPSTKKYWDHTLKYATEYPSRSSIYNLSLNIFTDASLKRPNNVFPDPSFKITPEHLSISTLPHDVLLTLNNARTDKKGNIYKTKQSGIIGYLHPEPFSDGHVI